MHVCLYFFQSQYLEFETAKVIQKQINVTNKINQNLRYSGPYTVYGKLFVFTKYIGIVRRDEHVLLHVKFHYVALDERVHHLHSLKHLIDLRNCNILPKFRQAILDNVWST